MTRAVSAVNVCCRKQPPIRDRINGAAVTRDALNGISRTLLPVEERCCRAGRLDLIRPEEPLCAPGTVWVPAACSAHCLLAPG
ncbi:hypothetical protein NDU88_000739 [Pleurodeles waltl]|uniref:Uncharacterized protein n=1 Tax=Pleurodeles waltl TaxID=8319 RepID=A0AAV7MIY8_PLEWA|nr:hypothetical protein NDU88_000739 [Pleurodeles waltl]